MDSEGSHGMSGMPHTLDAHATGTSSWMPSVPATHARHQQHVALPPLR